MHTSHRCLVRNPCMHACMHAHLVGTTAMHPTLTAVPQIPQSQPSPSDATHAYTKVPIAHTPGGYSCITLVLSTAFCASSVSQRLVSAKSRPSAPPASARRWRKPSSPPYGCCCWMAGGAAAVGAWAWMMLTARAAVSPGPWPATALRRAV